MTTNTCTVCATQFQTKRSDSKFCSAKCRKTASRTSGDPTEASPVSPARHTCDDTCVFYIEVDGVRRERYSEAHWQSLRGPVTAEDLANGWTPAIYPNPVQRDCKAGVLQPDGSRKIYTAQ